MLRTTSTLKLSIFIATHIASKVNEMKDLKKTANDNRSYLGIINLKVHQPESKMHLLSIVN